MKKVNERRFLLGGEKEKKKGGVGGEGGWGWKKERCV